jgi:hypothetical protein
MLPSLKGAVDITLSTVFAGFAAQGRLKETTVMITATAPNAVARETLKLRDTISLRFLFIEGKLAPILFPQRIGPGSLPEPGSIKRSLFREPEGSPIARIRFRARKLKRRCQI